MTDVTPGQESFGLSAERLKRISEAVTNHLKSEPVLPWWGFQYLLSEVGPAFRRMDPRELEAALDQLVDRTQAAQKLPQGPWEPLLGIYVKPTITGTNAEHHARIAAVTKEDQLVALAAAHSGNRAELLGSAVAPLVHGHVTEEVDLKATEGLGGSARWSRGGVRIESEAARSGAACIWLTNELSWVFPDDARLWRHLLYCLERGQRPLVAARKIAVSTFPLLKRLGAFGVQFHHLYLPPTQEDHAQALAGAPPVLAPSDATTQVAVQETLVNALGMNWSQEPSAAEGIRLASEVGLHDGEGAGISGLRRWLQQSSIPMPVPWKAQLTRYERWARVARS
jgi:hypothetical protein